MKIKYTPCEYPIETPCLMKSEHGEIFLVTDGPGDKKFVTRISGDGEDMDTWESDLKNYKPMPKGSKFEFIN